MRTPNYDAYLDRQIDEYTRDDTYYGICPVCSNETHYGTPCSGCEDCGYNKPCSISPDPCGGKCENCNEEYCLDDENATDKICGDCGGEDE